MKKNAGAGAMFMKRRASFLRRLHTQPWLQGTHCDGI